MLMITDTSTLARMLSSPGDPKLQTLLTGAVKLSGDQGESLMEHNAHRTKIDRFAYPTFPKLRGPTTQKRG
jgi:hypothetical protein